MAKKDFKTAAVMGIINPPQGEPKPAEETPDKKKTPTGKAQGAPEGYKIDPRYIEVKSRRVQLVMQPSLYSRVKAAAEAAGLSVNEYICGTLDAATQKEGR